MRDYIVLYRLFDSSKEQGFYWVTDDPGSQGEPHDDGFSVKTYVRLPDQTLLASFFNHDLRPFVSNFVSIDGNHFAYGEAWGRIFGGDVVGGYSKVDLVPTSAAYGAIPGRPARDSRGRFIRHF